MVFICSRTGKESHETRGGAIAQMRKLRVTGKQSRKDKGMPIEIFHCRFCRGWHFGHRRNKVLQK
jgi:hypothetical protein